jgi:DNA polymerase-3 subunit epsilon
VYLALTSGQGALGFDDDATHSQAIVAIELSVRVRPRVLRALDAELVLHEARIAAIDKASRGACVWKRLTGTPADAPIQAEA